MQCYIILKKHKNAPVWKTLIKFNLKETLIEKNLIQKCKLNSLYHPFQWEITRAFYVILFVMNGKLTSWSFMEGNTLLCYFMEHGLWVLQPGMCGVEITEFQIYEISCVGHFQIFIFYEYILRPLRQRTWSCRSFSGRKLLPGRAPTSKGHWIFWEQRLQLRSGQ